MWNLFWNIFRMFHQNFSDVPKCSGTFRCFGIGKHFKSVPKHSNVSETFQKFFENILLCFQNVPKFLIWPAPAKFIARHVAMEEEKENEEKLNEPSRFTETKQKKDKKGNKPKERGWRVLVATEEDKKKERRKASLTVHGTKTRESRWRKLPAFCDTTARSSSH